ncbi:quinone-dependent dihydroorotate dehydrogenase [Microlunatus sp. Y2014]|uniref:quinone-dependent dihydroorotate dehydrogenase n=1 Tax=Microlunatus sp. Y2014 TaxID=3418488 RepID=UPI003DA7973D
MAYRAVRPALFALGGGDAEVAHEATLAGVRRIGSIPPLRRLVAGAVGPRGAEVDFAGLRFPGPVGLAAGMDKNGIAVPAWAALGFSHVELGTVTALAQPGNERPRLQRLRTSRAIINRMGFNNAGAQALADRLAGFGIERGNGAAGLIVGVSIGKSKVVELADAVPDYLTSLRAVAPHADYVAINVSSPNTPGLRSLQDKGFLTELVAALVAETRQLDRHAPVPVLVKLAPDLTDEAVDEAVTVCEDGGVAGLIATNTTIDRGGIAVRDRHLADQPGGLSGAPLTTRSRAFVSRLTRHSRLPVIGVGGIMTADHADAMLGAGATLVQVYSGLIYRGPGLVTEINRRHRHDHDRLEDR